MQLVKRFFCFLLAPLIMVLFTGCNNASQWNSIKAGNELKIAVLAGSNEYEEQSTFLAGVKLAIDDLKGKGYKVSYKLFVDDNNFDKGVSLAKEIINNKEYKMAFSFQNMDTLDTVAKLFEDAKKPLFIIDGASDRTMKKVSKYVFNLVSSAENMGFFAGKYAVKQGYKSVAIAHDNTSFTIDFIEGFNDAIYEDSSVTVVDSVRGPTKEQEFGSVYSRWESLGIDCILISFDDTSWSAELINLIRSKKPDIAIITDPYMNSPSLAKQYAQAMEGVVMPSSSPVGATSGLNKFYQEYRAKVTTSLTPLVAQGFDLLNMIVSKMQDNTTVEEFTSAMKSNDGYKGVTTIKFNANGGFEENPNYLIIKNGAIVKLDV